MAPSAPAERGPVCLRATDPPDPGRGEGGESGEGGSVSARAAGCLRSIRTAPRPRYCLGEVNFDVERNLETTFREGKFIFFLSHRRIKDFR